MRSDHYICKHCGASFSVLHTNNRPLPEFDCPKCNAPDGVVLDWDDLRGVDQLEFIFPPEKPKVPRVNDDGETLN